MTRLASIAKAGFYPTPLRVCEWIARYVLPSQDSARLLDPCSGEGIAAANLAQSWHLESYGIEIDAERAQASAQRLTRVLHLDYAAARISQHAFQVLFLNPPYSPEEGEARRMEYRFLRDTTKWLQPQGLLIYIIPQYRLEARMARFLATYYSDLRAYRFPDPEYDYFRQMVVFAILKPEPLFDEQVALTLLQECHGSLPILAEQPEVTFSIPRPEPVKPRQGPAGPRGPLGSERSVGFFFRGNVIDPDEALAEALKAGAWHSNEWSEWLEPQNGLGALQPLMPLKKGHLAMLIAAGLLQNLKLEQEGEQFLIKGRTYKVAEEVESEGENEQVVRDCFVTEIVAVDLQSGEVTRLDEPQALSEFIEKWQDVIAQQVIATFTPLYQFDMEREGERVLSVLNRLSKQRRLPGRKETGLFAAQKHVAVALWRRFQRDNFAILVGEMGVGKTTIASAVSALMGAKSNPTLILCPPHLVNKWVREVREIVPLSFTMPLYRLSDVERFVREFNRLSEGTPAFAVLSREMAKLGSGWQPAYARRKRLMQLNGDRKEVLNLCACPRCGHVVHHVEGNQETAPVLNMGYFEKKRCCFECNEPLYQMTHLNGRASTSFSEFDEQISEPHTLSNLRPKENNGTARFPIADYIARRYRGFFKLLVTDEVHQLKGQSTDQGYAFGSLIRVCNKTLALTGTLYGGRATLLFFLLHRLSPKIRERFLWSDGQKWAERYGILERITKTSEDNDEYGVYSGKRRRKTFVRELPGISPELVMQLLDSTAFLALSDLGFELPEYREEPVVLSMVREQRIAYDQLQTALEDELRTRLAEGDNSLLGAYLQSLLSYPNSCFREEVVRAPDGQIVASAPSLGEDRLFPKEEWLVNLAIQERTQGRRMLVFCRQTGTRDITTRLKGLLQQAGLRTGVLNANVGTQAREDWLRHRIGQGLDVLITNPKLVETGLDLVAFQTTAFFELDYSIYTMQQAARRTWRLGQVDDVITYYAVYADTMEHRAMGLIAQKLAAALLLTGDAVEGALVQQTDSSRGFLADLAKSVISGAQISDLNSLFRERSHERNTSSEFLGVSNLNWAAIPEEDEVGDTPRVINLSSYQQLSLM